MASPTRKSAAVSTRSVPRTRPHHGCRAQHRLRRTQPAAWVAPEPLCVLPPQATGHAGLHYLQVRTPRMPYKGQKATKAVRSGTTPIKPTQRIGPCNRAIREKSPSATTILMPRSTEPTFLFTEKSLLGQRLSRNPRPVGNQSYKASCCAANSSKALRLHIVTNPRSRAIQPCSSNRPSNRVMMTRTLPSSSAIC